MQRSERSAGRHEAGSEPGQPAAPAQAPRVPQARIDVGRTLALHQRLVDLLDERPREVADAVARANGSLRKQDKSFGGMKELHVPLSALLVEPPDIDSLETAAETLHGAVETVLDWLMRDRGRLETYFADHRRIFPWLGKTRGCDHWQVFSRYDVVVDPTGRLRVIELNTGCPAGFMHSESFTEAAADALAQLGACSALPLPTADAIRSATIRRSGLVDGLLEIERRAGIGQGLVALLTDENNLTLELELIAEALARRDREARIVDAATLEYRGGRLLAQGQPVSLAYNKFRISVPTSTNHFWRVGFEQRYAALLAAVRDGAVVAANNLATLTISEDKSLLGLLSLAEVQALLSDAQRRFVADHVLWTTRLADTRVTWEGREVDLLPLVRAERERLVIKPCNEGRGFGVHLGRYTDPDVWERLCTPDPATPRVVQQYVEPLSLEVICDGAGAASVRPCFLTLGLAVINGRYEGILSRVSPSRVTNVAREGMVQAVLRV